jgi:HD-GYP domain-containing protein (c-di-GMP phosphodiesterase class II)
MTQESLEVLTKDLLLGMFVEDLDRPWLDTPFLIQGFLLDDDRDIETLRKLCHRVYVDPLRSTVAVPRAPSGRERTVATDRTGSDVERSLEVIRPSVRANVGNPSLARGRARDDDDRTSSSAPHSPREKIVIAPDPKREMPPNVSLGDWRPAAPAHASEPDTGAAGIRFNPLSRLKGLFDDLAHAWRETRVPSVPLPAVADEYRPDPTMAPPGVKLMVYPDEVPLRDELPRAEKSFARARETLDRLAQDMRTGTGVDVEGVDEVVNDMVDSMISSPDALMWIARMRQQHSDIYSHGVQVGVYLLALGRHLGFPKTQLGHLGTMGLLLDLGKTALPRTLLEKPGRLTDQEFELMKRHVEYGLEVVSSGPKSLHPDVLEGIAQHHERLNGLGYPKGLRGEEIGVYGRMAGIADCFAALTSPRPYADALSVSDAMMRLYKWGDELFAQPLVEKLIQAIGVFPVGSLVELSSGEVAVVIRHNRVRRLQPTVLVIAGPDKQPLQRFRTLDLLHEPNLPPGNRLQVRRGLPAGAYGLDTSACYLSAA